MAEPVMNPACRVTMASPLTRTPHETGMMIVGFESRTAQVPVQRIEPGTAPQNSPTPLL